MYSATTHDIEVQVEPIFLPERSDADESRYLWAYHVIITNHGSQTVQLLERYWRITDGNGHVEEVRGAGVVGDQPVLEPGGTYSYTSGCPLSTSSGFMEGSYLMTAPGQRKLDIQIPAFALDLPDISRTVN